MKNGAPCGTWSELVKMKAHKTEHIIKARTGGPDFSAYTYEFNQLYWSYTLEDVVINWDCSAVCDRVRSHSFFDKINADTYPL